jgi:hypothetical protein
MYLAIERINLRYSELYLYRNYISIYIIGVPGGRYTYYISIYNIEVPGAAIGGLLSRYIGVPGAAIIISLYII